PLQGRGQHEPEVVAAHELAGRTRELFAARRERDVGAPGVPAGPRPLGLAMPQQDELARGTVGSRPIGQRVEVVHDATVPASVRSRALPLTRMPTWTPPPTTRRHGSMRS